MFLKQNISQWRSIYSLADMKITYYLILVYVHEEDFLTDLSIGILTLPINEMQLDCSTNHFFFWKKMPA